MPETRKHRGPHPNDPKLFAAAHVPRLCQAVADLSWLLGRGYAINSALKLTGDRYNLTDRQRLAVRRSACSDEAVDRRKH